MSENEIQNIGRYEIEREIGRGGMAIVYKAHDPHLNRPVAIKLIRKGGFTLDQLETLPERFKREAWALARLSHSNIVQVYDYGYYGDMPYLVMEYLEGVTLKEVKKPLKVAAAVRLLRPIAEALDYVHSQGMLHRDVKPSNIIITRDEKVRLTDFGIAKFLDDSEAQQTLTGTGVGIGTPEYMAPEQGLGRAVDARSDQYALSVVFYELITGRKPFTGDTPVAILTKQAVEPFPDPRQFVSELNESVTRFFDRALAKNPEDRYETMGDYLRDLDGLRLQSISTERQTSNSGIQTVPRKSETASSVRIDRGALEKVRGNLDESNTAEIGSLIERTFLFLEDGDWKTADAYCERILDRDPKNGTVYLAKLMGKLKVRRIEDLENLSEPFDGDGLYEKAIRFGDEALRSRLEGMNRAIRERKSEKTYQDGIGFLERKAYADAERVFASIPDYQDAGKLMAEARNAKLREEERKRESAKWARDAAKKKRKRFWTWAAIAVVLVLGFFIFLQWRQNMIRQEQIRVIRARQTQSVRETQAAAAQVAKYQVGSIIRFGRYEQDNNLSNGSEEIRWRILAREGDMALVVSVMGLDAKPYNEEYKDITWEDCTLRSWLNNEFYHTAFNDRERGMIELTHVVNEDNPSYSTKGGNDTEDYVFLLSIGEAKQYFKDRNDRIAKPTDYAIANGAYVNSDNGSGWWWLRSPGGGQFYASDVLSDGDFYSFGDYVYDDERLVRPALRINLGK